MVVRVNGSTGIITVSGTSGAPSLRGPDGNSGISFDGDQVIISSSGLVAATFSDSAATINNLSVDTTTFEFSPGSSGTPTIAASGDLNTGIYFPAADTIGFAEGGNEAARFDSSGRLLVSTTGTIATGTGDKVQVAETVGANIILGRNDTVVTDSNNLGQIAAYSFHGSSWNESARIQFAADGAHAGSGDVPGRISFQVCTDGAAGVGEQMQLDNAGNLRFNSGYGSVATAYGCRAWARIEQIGTQSILGSGGITSISDLGTGMTQVNFSFTMPDTNYAVVSIGNPSTAAHTLIADDLASYQTTTSCRIACRNTGFTLTDSGNAQIAIFR